jgi:hypothetical protein
MVLQKMDYIHTYSTNGECKGISPAGWYFNLRRVNSEIGEGPFDQWQQCH